MISAREGDDFSFTLTAWGEGIRPYDFDLPYGYEAKGDILHTVFDRALVRQGETINMKHILRTSIGAGFGMAPALEGRLRLVASRIGHRSSTCRSRSTPTASARSSWTAPQGAPMGDYDLQVIVGRQDDLHVTVVQGR